MTNSITERMSLGNKIKLFIDYLQYGGEVEVDNRIWVWLDNHVVRKEVNEGGDVSHYGIDGLAIKGVMINGGTGEETPHYMGQSDIPLHSFIDLVNEVSESDWLGIVASNALKGMNKKRNLKSEEK